MPQAFAEPYVGPRQQRAAKVPVGGTITHADEEKPRKRGPGILPICVTQLKGKKLRQNKRALHTAEAKKGYKCNLQPEI
ncbi:MAG TPA: hypothetical protein VHM90_11795 [Phycisphaerae bacterium]|jgi:hypothetical protein|nr:hypothetical protein [Phycisphaerae bacterium]